MWTLNLLVIAGLASVKAQDISFDGCNKTSVCVKAPRCTTPQNCEALVMYHHNVTTDRLHFKMYFKTKWAAFAQNTFVKNGDRMVDAKGFTCTFPVPLSETKVEPLALRFMLAKGLGAPELAKHNEISDISDVELSTINGVHMCSFSRPIELNSVEGFKFLYNLDLSVDLLNIIVIGNKLIDTDLDYHGSGNYFVDKKEKPVSDWKAFTGVVKEEIKPLVTEIMPSSSASQMVSMYDNSMMMTSSMMSASMSVGDSVSMTTEVMMMSRSESVGAISSMVSTTPDMELSTSKAMVDVASTAIETPMVQPTVSSSTIEFMSSKAPTTKTTTQRRSTRPPVSQDPNGDGINLSHATTCTASITLLVITVSAFIAMML